MNWLAAIDGTVLRWINSGLSNPLLDSLCPFVTDGKFLPAVLLLGAILLLWKGGARGRIMVLSLCIILPLGQLLVVSPIKDVIGRDRPFKHEATIRLVSGVILPHSGGMPSGHTAIWFAGTALIYIFYRRSLYFMLPCAMLIGFSRMYEGVHYPGDVLAGAIIGMGYATAGLWLLNSLWRAIGKAWFPIWWSRLPNLFVPVVQPISSTSPASKAASDYQWIHLGYVMILLMLVGNLAYNASGAITLSGDEAYQWIWSKHLALSYYSKPLLIALTQFTGTHLWGDTVFGVRFFSPVIAALTAFAVLRFMGRVANPRLAFWTSVILPATPLLAVGSILMTIDPLNVMFWIFAMIAGWRAVQEEATLKDWVWVGVWTGLGLLSKYTALFQLASWVLFFAISKKARLQLSKPGPWIALLLVALSSLPIVIWNLQNHWITIRHVSQGGNFDKPWQFTSANLWHGFVKYTLEFVAEEIGLLNPFFFVPAIAATILFWRMKGKQSELMRYLFSMGAPVFVVYLLLTFHSRVLPNWIAPSIIPFFCLGMIYWEQRYNDGLRMAKGVLVAGLILGGVGMVLLHDLSLVETFTGWRIPDALDSTRRVKGWTETATIVENARQKLERETGKTTFIIGGHYSDTGEMTFQIPEARERVKDDPMVYYITSTKPDNQFFFWPGYQNRKGQNAIFMHELDFNGSDSPAPDATLTAEFESVTDIGPVTVYSNGHPMRRIQLLECRGLR